MANENILFVLKLEPYRSNGSILYRNQTYLTNLEQTFWWILLFTYNCRTRVFLLLERCSCLFNYFLCFILRKCFRLVFLLLWGNLYCLLSQSSISLDRVRSILLRSRWWLLLSRVLFNNLSFKNGLYHGTSLNDSSNIKYN